MKSIKQFLLISSLLLLALFLTSCSSKNPSTPAESAPQQPTTNVPSAPSTQPGTLPVRYQTPKYVIDRETQENTTIAEESKLKVGARISSTKAILLVDIVKKLASFKGMNVSWASDVDQRAKVDVDINANDYFYDAINNLLAQVAYFAEFKDTTIFVKNKISKQYRIAMPFVTQEYSNDTGGDIIGAGDNASGYKALISLKTKGSPVGTSSFDDNGARKSEFDIWANIEANLKVILDILESSGVETNAYERQYGSNDSLRAARNDTDSASGSRKNLGATASQASRSNSKIASQKVKTSRQVSKDGSYFIIDKPVGIITVTTTRALQERVDNYISSLTKAIYQQISIEAKIIEIQLNDQSSIGINWSSVLKNFSLKGVTQFGAGGQIYPFTYSNDNVVGDKTYSADGSSYTKTINPGQFVSKISMLPANFNLFLNALNEQGDTKILSNPKISVMNGQPALITVGRNVTYIDSIDSDLDSDSGVITYSVNTERILSGVGLALTATILGKDAIIMNLVPITSELEQPIEYRSVGSDGGTVGLPIVNIREMSTTVKVGNGEMLVIGGLISDIKETKGEFAPVLGDIPLLRYLFGWEEKTHRKRELIILLRPRII